MFTEEDFDRPYTPMPPITLELVHERLRRQEAGLRGFELTEHRFMQQMMMGICRSELVCMESYRKWRPADLPIVWHRRKEPYHGSALHAMHLELAYQSECKLFPHFHAGREI